MEVWWLRGRIGGWSAGRMLEMIYEHSRVLISRNSSSVVYEGGFYNAVCFFKKFFDVLEIYVI